MKYWRLVLIRAYRDTVTFIGGVHSLYLRIAPAALTPVFLWLEFGLTSRQAIKYLLVCLFEAYAFALAAIFIWKVGSAVPSLLAERDVATKEPEQKYEADRRTLTDLIAVLPSHGDGSGSGGIDFLRTNNFAGFSFNWEALSDIERFLYTRNSPQHEFIDSELESLRLGLLNAIRACLTVLGDRTFPTNQLGRNRVPEESEYKDPKEFHETVRKIHTATEGSA